MVLRRIGTRVRYLIVSTNDDKVGNRRGKYPDGVVPDPNVADWGAEKKTPTDFSMGVFLARTLRSAVSFSLEEAYPVLSAFALSHGASEPQDGPVRRYAGHERMPGWGTCRVRVSSNG